MNRQWLYHKNAEATIFTGDDAIQKALSEGWVDTPAKLKPSEAMEAEIVEKHKSVGRPKSK